MEREMNLATNAVIHRAYVLKGLDPMLYGNEIDDPTSDSSHITLANLGGAHVGVQVAAGQQGTS